MISRTSLEDLNTVDYSEDRDITFITFFLCRNRRILSGVQHCRCCNFSYTSSGHSMNQSMVQQLTMEGNMRRRVRKASPKGDMQSTMWMLALTRLIYCV